MFPLLYHTHHNAYIEDLPFWQRLVETTASPALELGCGSGRVLSALDQTGKQVFGLDYDIGMLRVLQQYLPEASASKYRVFQADFTAFRLAAQFGLMILPCNTLSTLEALKRQQLLKCVIDHLKPGGVFAASMPNPELLKKLPRHANPEIEEIFPHPLDGEPVQVSSEWQRDTKTLTLLWNYDHLLPTGQVERLTAKVVHYLSSKEAYQEELEIAGFRSVKWLGDYQGSAPSETSDQLILIATK